MTIRQYRAVQIDAVPIHPQIAKTAARYKDLVGAQTGKSIFPAKITQQRLSYIYGLLPEDGSYIDVGVGNGELINAVAAGKKMGPTTGIDRVRRRDLQAHGGWELIVESLGRCEVAADTVTCLECIEHIPDPDFDPAVANLKKIVRKRLLVSVPYLEPEPLPKAHHQRFDMDRLHRLFPRGRVTLLLKGNLARWALVEWAP